MKSKKKVKRKKQQRVQVETDYIFEDERRHKLYCKNVTRYIDKSKKNIKLFYYDKKGELQPGTGPKEMKWCHRYKPLYNLPDLYETRNTDEDIWFVEGEKDVKALQKLGLIATCSIIGAGGKWEKGYGTWMVDRNVNIIPDNDDDGIEYARKMAEGAVKVAAEVRIVKLPDLINKPDGYDVSDWIEENKGKSDKWLTQQLEEFREEGKICTAQNVLRFPSTNIEELKKEPPLTYIIKNLIVDKSFNALIGPPKITKTTHAAHIAFAIQTGRDWLGLPTQQKYCGYISTEPKVTMLPKLLAAENILGAMVGEVLSNEQKKLWKEFHFLPGRPLLNSKDIIDLVKTIKTWKPPPQLIFIDPLQDTIKGSENNPEDMKAYVDAIRIHIMEQFDCAVLLLHHTPLSSDIRARGSSVLVGSWDHEIIIQRECKGVGPAKIICGNSRVCDEFYPVYTYLEKMTVNKEADVTALRVRASDKEEYEEIIKKKQVAKGMDDVEKLIEILVDAPGLSSTALRKESDLKKTKFYNAFKIMKKKKTIINKGTEHSTKWYLSTKVR